MAPNVQYTITANVAQAFASVEAFAKYLQSVGFQAAAVGVKSQQSGVQAGSALGNIARNAAQVTATFIGIGSALQAISTATAAIRKEYEALKTFQNESADQQVRVAAAFRGVQASMSALSPELLDMTPDDIYKIAHTGVGGLDPEQTLRVFRASISAALGEVPLSERIKVAQQAILWRRDLDEQDVAQYSSSATSLVQQYGGTAKQQLAMMTMAESLSRVEDPQKFAKYIVSAVSQLAGFGFTEGQAFSIANAIGTRASESEGQITGTQSITLMKKVMEETAAKYPGVRGMAAVEAFRSDPELRKRVLGAFDIDVENMLKKAKAGGRALDLDLKSTIPGRGRAFIPSVEFLTKAGVDTKTKQYYEESLRVMPTLEAAVLRMEEVVRQTQASSHDLTFQMRNLVEEFRFTRQSQAGQGIAGEMARLLELLPNLGIGSANIAEVESLISRVGSADDAAIPGRLKAVKDKLVQIEWETKRTRYPSFGERLGGEYATPGGAMLPSGSDLSLAETLRRLANGIDVVIANNEASLAMDRERLDMEKQRTATPQPVRDATPRYNQPSPAATPRRVQP